MKIVIATGNAHKKEEIYDLLGNGFEVVTMKEEGINIDIVEDGVDFEENALIKARALTKYTKEVIIADDSGLSVDVLNGQPGVYSARYAGIDATDEKNNSKLLKELDKWAIEERSATFVCVIAVIKPNGEEYLFRGECKGFIGFEYKGDHGFGYDPLFIVKGTEKTFAQLTSQEKNLISHRAIALQKLRNSEILNN